MASKVFLHVGTPKTGTSYVQDLLFLNPRSLAAQGILYPADRHDEQFLAALDLMQLTWGGLEHEAVGAWERLARRVREFEGTVIVSHEIFGAASRAHVERALASLGDAEVHVVLSARDLARQIPAEWQENVKHRRTVEYSEFLDRIREEDRTSEIAGWFWGVQEVPAVLDRWASTLPPERVHLVTVPRPGAPRGLLWERFAGVFGIEPDSLEEVSNRANPSLGVPETALIRRLNTEVNNVLPNEHYRLLVREMLVHRTLSKKHDSPRLTVPPEVWAWADELESRWLEELAARGYRIVGSLEELRSDEPHDFVDPDAPPENQVAAAGVTSMSVLLQEVSRLLDIEQHLHGIIQSHERVIDGYRGTATYRYREKAIRFGEEHPVGRVGMRAYRALRGRSSLSA